MKSSTRIAALLLVLLLAAPGSAATFSKIADQSMLGPTWVPGSVTFGKAALDQGVVAFTVTDGYSSGILTGSGGPLATVVDGSPLVPGSTTPFSWTSDVSISNGQVAFMANDAAYFPAIYTTLGGTLAKIAYFGMPDPEGGPPLQIAGVAPSIDGDNVAFRVVHGSLGEPAYFTSVGGSLELSADESTSVPGGDYLVLLGSPSLDGTSVAFRAQTLTTEGIYVASADVARVVADTTTPVPGGTGTFASFSGILASDDGNVVFEAYASNGGLYAEIGGVLMWISDELIDGASIDGDDVAWYGTASLLLDDPAFYSGLYALIDGQRVTVIETSDVLDGRIVSYFGLGPEALSDSQLAFTAYFEDGTSGVYLATIPEPGTAVLLASGLAVLAARRRWAR